MNRVSRFCLLFISLFLIGFSPKEPLKESLGSSDQSAQIPLRFLEKEDLVPKMVQLRQEWVFDLYLLLLRDQGEKQGEWQEISLDELAGAIGISRRLNRSVYHRILLQSLEILQSDFHLIKINFGKRQTVSVQLLDYDDPQLPFSMPEEGRFEIPGGYWTFGWNQKLSLSTKWIYLVHQIFQKMYPAQKQWGISSELLHRRFHLSEEFFKKGSEELRRYHLINIQYRVEPSRPNQLQKEYHLLPIYDPQAVEKAISNLSTQYTEARVKLIRNYARLIYAEYDPAVIGQLAQLYYRYGDYSFKKIMGTIAEEPTDSPKRSLEYVTVLCQEETK